jgi:CRISPR system Cascade subunit CasA
LWNLLDEPWLRVRLAPTPSGTTPPGTRTRRVGVRELLLDAHTFAAVEVDFPTQRPALYRQLLLPIVVDALGGPPVDAKAWAELFSPGAFTPERRDQLAAYLDRHHDRFGLFSDTDPFAQVAGLRTGKDVTKSATLLVATAAQGNNVPLFSARTDGDVLELTPAEAAHWLLNTHCWDTGAIKTGAVGDDKAQAGKTTGNPVGPLGRLGVVMPLGVTVFDTLLLNIPYGVRQSRPDPGRTGEPRDPAADRPQWRRRETYGDVLKTRSCATPAWEARACAGLLDLWTWQSRRARLVPERTEDGRTVVTRCVITAGDRIEAPSIDLETHTAWHVDSDDGSTRRRGAAAKRTASGRGGTSDPLPYRPVRHRSGRSGWRGLNALLAVADGERDRNSTADTAGFHTSVLLSRIGGLRVDHLIAPDYPLQIELTGVAYGDKLGFVEDTFHDEIPLPITALHVDSPVRGGLLRAVDQAEQLARAVDGLARDLRRAAGQRPAAAGGRGPRPDTATQAGAALLHALDPHVRALLRDLRKIPEHAREQTGARLDAWERTARRETWKVADSLLSAASPTLFAGREVEQQDGTKRTYRLSNAEQIFRAALNKILWPPESGGNGGEPGTPPGPPAGIPSPTPPPIGSTAGQELPG